MKKFVVLCLAGLSSFCSESKPPEVPLPPATVLVRIQGNSTLDDVDLAVRPWRLTLRQSQSERQFKVSLTDPRRLFTWWEVSNTNPKDKSDAKLCPGFRESADITDVTSEITVPASPGQLGHVCRYNITLRAAGGTTTPTEIVVDPEYRLGP